MGVRVHVLLMKEYMQMFEKIPDGADNLAVKEVRKKEQKLLIIYSPVSKPFNLKVSR